MSEKKNPDEKNQDDSTPPPPPPLQRDTGSRNTWAFEQARKNVPLATIQEDEGDSDDDEKSKNGQPLKPLKLTRSDPSKGGPTRKRFVKM